MIIWEFFEGSYLNFETYSPKLNRFLVSTGQSPVDYDADVWNVTQTIQSGSYFMAGVAKFESKFEPLGP